MKRIENCPVCECADIKTHVKMGEQQRSRYMEYSRIKYGGLLDGWIENLSLDVLVCSSCGHFLLSHQPDERALSAMYAAGRPLRGEKNEVSRKPTSGMLAEMARLRRLVQKKDEPKLLDYGSGFGRWARAAVLEGFSVTAFEPSAERGKEKKEVEFEVVHDLSVLQGRTFDVVNVEQVLEHIPDPVSALRAMHCLGNEETIFRFTVPNILRPSEGRKIWDVWPFDGVHAHTLAPFEHLHGFTPKSLGLALERSGFKSVEASALWKHCPLRQVRFLSSFLFPCLGQTLFLARRG